MATALTNPAQFKAIADAIRAKTGETGKIVANDFATKIAAIQTGVAKPHWKSARLTSAANWTSICYGNGWFVAVDDTTGYVISSSNCTTWTEIPVSNPVSTICYGKSKFVAIAYDSSVAAYSTDGVNWTQATLPAMASWS